MRGPDAGRPRCRVPLSSALMLHRAWGATEGEVAMMKTARSVLGLVTAAVLSACSEGQTAAVIVRPPTTVELPVYVDACPLAHLRGVRARVENVPGGVSIVFTGPDRVVDLLRGNVRAMAAASDREGNPFAVCPCADTSTPGGAIQAARTGGTSDLGVTSMQAPSSTALPPGAATATDTPTGATLVLTGADGEEADALRSSARRQVSAMAECLSGMGH